MRWFTQNPDPDWRQRELDDAALIHERRNRERSIIYWRETTPPHEPVPPSTIHPVIMGLIRDSDPNFTTLENWKHRVLLKNWENWKSLGLVTEEPPQAQAFRDIWTDDKDERIPDL